MDRAQERSLCSSKSKVGKLGGRVEGNKINSQRPGKRYGRASGQQAWWERQGGLMNYTWAGGADGGQITRRGEGQLTCEEAPDLLDEKPRVLDVFFHLHAAGAHLGLEALGI